MNIRRWVIACAVAIAVRTGADAADRSARRIHLEVVHATPSWRVLPPTRTDGLYTGIARGRDGQMWIADSLHGLERVDSSGTRQRVPLPFADGGQTHHFLPAYLAFGSDRELYMTGCVDGPSACATIGILAPHQNVFVYSPPSGESARFSGIAIGPDGDAWFTEASHVAKIDRHGAISEYPYGTGEVANEFSGIAPGSDGKMWFTELDRIAVANVDPTTGGVAEFRLAAQNTTCGTSGMSALDNELYFACEGGSSLAFSLAFIGSTTSGELTYYYTSYFYSNGAQEIASYENKLWLVGPAGVQSFDAKLQRLTIYALPDTPTTLYGSAAGPDGKPWILAENGAIYVLETP